MEAEWGSLFLFRLVSLFRADPSPIRISTEILHPSLPRTDRPTVDAAIEWQKVAIEWKMSGDRELIEWQIGGGKGEDKDRSKRWNNGKRSQLKCSNYIQILVRK